MTPAELTAWLVTRLSELTSLPPGLIEVDRPLRDLGVSSRDAIGVAGELGDVLGRPVAPDLVYRHPSITELVTALLAPDPRGHRTGLVAAVEPIAVIGVGCRLPGGIDSPARFWELLTAGRDVIGPRPSGRERPDEPGGYLDDVAGFDAEFFGVTAHEAASMDPQQRIMAEVAWTALEHAGIPPGELRGSRTGVFVGVSAAEYGALSMADPGRVDAWSGTGASAAIVANRLSYLLDLRGPSTVVDTACSSSLVAVHHALVSLQRGECDLALAGGVNLLLSEGPFATFRRAGLLAVDARCKAFDAAADGIVRGEGCGVVVLRRLADARSAGDRILAVLRGSATNSDGRSNGLMAPNPAAQTDLLREAYDVAAVDTSTVDFVEAHGTGTLLGDPIEAGALRAALGSGRTSENPLLLGSVKTNLGHLEGAAGIAGLIKVVLALDHGTVPAGLHFREPNPHIDFDGLRVVDAPVPWPRYSGRARAGVSAFGFGGTNAHVVVEEWPKAPPPALADEHRTELFAVSGADSGWLATHAADLADWLEERTDVPLADVAATLARRRDHGRVRGVVRAADRAAAVAGLRAIGRGDAAPEVTTGLVRAEAAAPVFVFSGFGSSWSGVGARLAAAEPAFADAVADLDSVFSELCGFSLHEALEGDDGDLRVAQPALFGVQIALSRYWESRGVRPAAVVGHSVGEVAAAVVAGALEIRQGLLVVRERARLLAALDTANSGAMAVVELPASEVDGRFPGVEVAVYASPGQCTVAGPASAVADLVARVTAEGQFARVLPIGAAAHTAAVEPGLRRFRDAVGSVTSSAPSVRVFSSVLEDPLAEPKFDLDHWTANLRRPVRFAQALRAAGERGSAVFLEIAPHPVTLAAIEDTCGANTLALASTSRDADGFLPALAALHVTGHPGALRGHYPVAPVLDLPGPRWRHTRYWRATTPSSARHPLLGEHVEVPEDGRHLWQSEISTERLPWLADHALDGTPVFPATGYLELALAGGGKAVRELTLEVLLQLSAPVEVTSSLTGDEFTVLARSAGEWVTHARATVVDDDTAAPAPLLRVEGQDIDLYGRFADVGHAYGPAFRALHGVHAANGAASARLTLPEEAAHHPAYSLHPALADACLHVLAAAAASVGTAPGRYVPTVLGSVRLLGDPSRGTWCAAEVTASTPDGITGTVQLLADDDTVLVEFARVQAARLKAPVTVLEPRWEPAPLPATVPSPKTWALVSEVDTSELLAALTDAGDTVHTDPSRPADAVVLVAGEDADPDAAQRRVLRVAALVRELADRPEPPRLWLVTRGAHAVVPGESGRPGLAALRALIRVLAFEHPALRATHVDLDQGAPLVAELRADQPEDEVAWRDGRRFVAKLTRVVPAAGPVPAGPGAYVLTGGLGELGLLTAEWLARHGATRLVLNGRTGPAPGVLDGLHALGVHVDVVLGDLAEPGVAERLVERAQEGGVRLRGVVHGAGMLADRVLTDLDADDLARAWRPKVLGGLRLHEATEGVELDWWLAQSSLAGLVGSPGQTAHATANAWLDALVAARRAAGLPATTVNWAAWTREGTEDRLNAGLASIDPTTALDALGAVLADGRPAFGLLDSDLNAAAEVFPALADRPFLAGLVARATPAGRSGTVQERLLACVTEVLGIAPPDPRTPLLELGLDSLTALRLRTAVLREFGTQPSTALLLRGAGTAEIAADLGVEIGAAPSVIGARDHAERWISSLWCEVLDVPEVGVHDDFAGTAAAVGRLREAVTRRLGTEPAGLFDTPTVAGMADVVRELLDASPEGTVRTLRDGDGPPLHLFHPAGGTTSVYQPLVTALGRPCLGYERVDHLDSVEEKAAHYADLIADRQPAGPCAVAGWSFGGYLAYEVARVLTERGRLVGPVVLIDSILPLPGPDTAPLDRFIRFAEHVERTYGVPLGLAHDELAAAEEADRIGLVLNRVRAAVPGIGEGVLRHQHTSYVDARLAERYTPRPWDGPVVLLRAEQPHSLTTTLDPRYLRTDEALGWDALCPELRVVRVPGDHVSMIDPPHVTALAAALSAALDFPEESR
ncbi:beta-ketoacyl synthase N-terminal-like domain-containing protein [Amycolatopsis japonica]|uniref:beta-ketoacyl synthase N-terminal-like domain-containing protein n=1 Tax=Amycolatopsis japonica TaxID=208439 RepID=UPI00332904C2